MKTVKVQQDIRVEATGIEYKKGQEVEVSDELAKRHIGTGAFKELAAKVKPRQEAPKPVQEQIKAPEEKQ